MVLDSELGWVEIARLIDAVCAAGEAMALPYIAAQSDLSHAKAMCDQDGRAYAETRFEWVDPKERYWKNRRLALQAPFLTAARMTAEPFYYGEGRLTSWRHTTLLETVDCSCVPGATKIGSAIIAPVHLPQGVVGAVVWASRTPIAIEQVFATHADHLHGTALKLLSAHAEVTGRLHHPLAPTMLTRREVQCLRWAAAGKTDHEIAIILDLSISTVRFHLRNARDKLGAAGRAQAIQTAAGLGFVGASPRAEPETEDGLPV